VLVLFCFLKAFYWTVIIIWLILWLICTSVGLCDVVVLWQLAKHLNVSSCFFWCEGYHGRQLLCTIWESKSTHKMETYLAVGRLCPCTWSVIFLMGLNWLGLKLSSIFFLLFLFSRHIAVHSPIFTTLEYYTHARTRLMALCPGLPG